MADETSTLEERVAALEQRIAQLESRPHRAGPIPPPPRARERVRPTPAAADAARQQWFDSGEGWLGRAGVGLVVISFVFLYRYAVERGWLTPALRIALGVVVGAAMLGGGFMYFTDRRRYRQILMGGGVVLLFVTGLAASELYGLVPGIVALIWHTIIAGIAFQIASRQDDPLMASIAAAGALVPPSLLLADEVPGLWLFLYLLVVIRWAALLILTRGWRSLLIVSAACGVAATLYSVPAQDAVANTCAALVVLATWIGFAALPLARNRLGFDETSRPLLSPDLRFTLPALVTLALATIADISQHALSFEIVTAGATFGFALLAGLLYPSRDPLSPASPPASRNGLISGDNFSAALFASGIAAAAAILSTTQVPWRYVALAVLAAVLFPLAGRLRAPALVPLAHSIAIIVAFEFIAMLDRLNREGPFDIYALGFFAVAGLAILTARGFQHTNERFSYLGAAYVLVHALLATELGNVDGARWLASASYAAIGSALVLAGLSRQDILLQRAGLLSLALLVGRLFLFDLANADLGVRIVLFMVCGFAFLGLSYVFRERRRTA